ncbi:glycoside hydrolase [Meira miltonrushii]|uniref:Alpha-galactosidase n=1 Tax=Meira miltonrushii TaxID=1280837 RepID=A0A316VFG4_9BASI|nr:glycoside hydrolase [Meira miltonrushii]PWN36322.1 glycoside hydrolase [Meira miltonrushii]
MQLTPSFITLGLAILAAVDAAHLHKLATRADTDFQKPVLGYNTYNAVACSPTEQFAQAQVDALQSNGYLAAGYQMFQIDCGWQATDGSRNSSAGNAISQDLSAFPSGLKAMGEYATQRGFRFGMYTDAGVKGCDTTVPSPTAGSLGHESADAAQFASWNSSYVKYDNCYASGPTAADNAPKNPRTDFITRFSVMTRALHANGIKGDLTCQWGVPYQTPENTLEGPVDWTKNISSSFRLSDDINDSWASVVRILNQAIPIAASDKTGPGFHGDADLLEVGNGGLTFAEQQTHFAHWAMLKSALMISTDLTKASSQTHDLLTNKALIAINQDDLGKPIKLVQRFTGDHDLHAGPLSNGDLAVHAINWQSNSRSLTVDFSALNITSANVADLFAGSTKQDASSYTANVDEHGSIALRLSSIKYSNNASPNVDWIPATSGKLAGDTNVQDCSGCTGGKKVGDIGNGSGNTVTFDNINTSGSTATILFDYINCEIGYLNMGTNARNATISVNGGSPVTVNFPLSGYNWDADIAHNYRVSLDGFKAGSGNSIQIGGSTYGPDLDRIGILA